MLTHPSLEKIWRGPRGMRQGIDACVRAKCVMSTLTLIYSAVDALAALPRGPDTQVTRASFIDWVERYFYPLKPELSALDIYAARCGVVHAHSHTSDLSRKGKAKLIVYRWRVGHRPDDEVLAERARTAVIVELEELVEGVDRAVERFEKQVLSDASLRSNVERNVKELLCYEPWHPVTITVAA